jgi:hypothetical protein
MSDDRFREAQVPCHVCMGEGTIGDYVFSAEVTVCPHCEGTGEEPLQRRPVRAVASKERKRTLP